MSLFKTSLEFKTSFGILNSKDNIKETIILYLYKGDQCELWNYRSSIREGCQFVLLKINNIIVQADECFFITNKNPEQNIIYNIISKYYKLNKIA